MNFDLTEEQRLLDDTIGRLLAARYGFDDRRAHGREPGGWSREIWDAFAELGLLGLPFAEEDGGFGGGAIEMMVVAERMGAHLVLEPWLSTLVTCGALLRHGASEGQRRPRIEAIASGELVLAFAQMEAGSRFDLHDVSTTGRAHDDGWVLDGDKLLVAHGSGAREFIVTARTSGARRDRDGISLFLVPAEAGGVVVTPLVTTDGMAAANVTFGSVHVGHDGLLGEAGDGLGLVERAADETVAALVAEATGAMKAALDLTVDYLKVRKQFGRAIGSFQSLQHRAAEMLVALEQSRSMSMLAAMALGEADDAARRRILSAAKVEITRNARFIGEQAVQLHGGIGMTDEYAVGHYLKRLKAIENSFGDSDHHIARLAALGGPYG